MSLSVPGMIQSAGCCVEPTATRVAVGPHMRRVDQEQVSIGGWHLEPSSKRPRRVSEGYHHIYQDDEVPDKDGGRAQ